MNTLSFVSQVRIRLYDAKNNLLIDTGNPFDKQVVSINYPGAPPEPVPSFSPVGKR